jgi:hypothetical protein
MRKKVIAVTALFVLSLAAYAVAQAVQQNTYEVTAKTSPTRTGSSSKPVPIGLDFGYKVGEVAGNRPAVVKTYSIRFAGVRVNSSVAAACRSSVLESEGPDACPSKSIVGTGYIENATGATNNIADKSIACNAALSVVNLGNMKAAIYVAGSPTATDPREKCAIELAAPIPAKFVNRPGENSLDFTVPASLTHPGGPAISNAVVNVTSSIKKISKGGRGFFESRGGCVDGKRRVRVIFTPETGPRATESITVRCTR